MAAITPGEAEVKTQSCERKHDGWAPIDRVKCAVEKEIPRVRAGLAGRATWQSQRPATY